MYLHYLLTQDEDSLLSNFYQAQVDNPVPGDWVNQVTRDLENIELKLSMDDIKNISKEVLQKEVKECVEKAAFKYLLAEKGKREKVKYVEHNDMKMETYLCPSDMTTQEAKFLFLLRTKMVDVKVNFKNMYQDKMCPFCKSSEDTQEHVLECSFLAQNNNILMSEKPDLKWIWSDDIKKQKEIVKIFRSVWKIQMKAVKKL